MTEPWKILIALTLARAGMGFQFQSIASVAPFLTADLGLDKTQLGWLIGIYLLPGVLIAFPSGLLGARFGDKRVVLIGLLLMAAGGFGLALSGSFAAASAARFASGTGSVVLNVLLTKMVADWFDGKERLLAMAVLVKRAQRPDRFCYAAVAGWCVSILLLSRSSEPLIWIVVGGLIGGLPAGAFVALPTQVVRPEQRAPGMGVFYTFYYLGCALFPAVAGALYDAAATVAAPLWLAAAAAIACVPALALLRYVALR